ATCAEPANVVADMRTAASASRCAVRASTPNEAPSAAAAGKSGAPIRAPLRTACPECAGLLAIAADLHRAPLARLVASIVDERPATGVGAARFQPAPRAFGHCLAGRREHECEPACDAAPRRAKPDRTVLEPNGEACSARGLIEGRRGLVSI